MNPARTTAVRTPSGTYRVAARSAAFTARMAAEIERVRAGLAARRNGASERTVAAYVLEVT